MAVQLTAVGRISLEVEKAGNAYFAANTSVDCQVLEKDDEGATATVVIPEIGVEFRVSPWYNCDAAAKSLFQVNHSGLVTINQLQHLMPSYLGRLQL